MLRYLDYSVYTREVPDELSLGLTLLGCNLHCKNCHSQFVWDRNSLDCGKELNIDSMKNIIQANPYVSCILFFGGEWELSQLTDILFYIKSNTNLKTALYTGRDLNYFTDTVCLELLDYIKVGRYIEELGGLDSKLTNQHFYEISNGNFIDKTSLFQQRITL